MSVDFRWQGIGHWLGWCTAFGLATRKPYRRHKMAKKDGNNCSMTNCLDVDNADLDLNMLGGSFGAPTRPQASKRAPPLSARPRLLQALKRRRRRGCLNAAQCCSGLERGRRRMVKRNARQKWPEVHVQNACMSGAVLWPVEALPGCGGVHQKMRHS
jgi:hypothetical protein